MARRYTVVTLFPDLVRDAMTHGVTGRAISRGRCKLDFINPRDYAGNTRGSVDDAPYGGGPGMVMRVEPLRASLDAIKSGSPAPFVVGLTPQGRRLDQAAVLDLARHPHLVLVAGRYEGIDERFIERDCDAEWSIGDYVLSGGEIAALVILDAIIRTLPDVLGDDASAAADSFCGGILDWPHYTRPARIGEQSVPDVLLGGDHAAIARWRRKQALGRTWQRRPDLLERIALEQSDLALLREYQREARLAEGDATRDC
ncbi:MAG: tRNA (guanosine(37)-N1)-methyltransferase TrmD [Gammaproteobacteria bacterium]|nr:tRNA (guanosine(37)-N1)-methyltransferase TrmD [Gammaproteobacteria bacterium]